MLALDANNSLHLMQINRDSREAPGIIQIIENKAIASDNSPR